MEGKNHVFYGKKFSRNGSNWHVYYNNSKESPRCTAEISASDKLKMAIGDSILGNGTRYLFYNTGWQFNRGNGLIQSKMTIGNTKLDVESNLVSPSSFWFDAFAVPAKADPLKLLETAKNWRIEIAGQESADIPIQGGAEIVRALRRCIAVQPPIGEP